MKTKVLTAAFLAFMPVAAFACPGKSYEQASSCMDGYTWDEEAHACVEIVSS